MFRDDKLQLRISAGLKERLRIYALRTRLSMSKVVETLLQDLLNHDVSDKSRP